MVYYRLRRMVGVVFGSLPKEKLVHDESENVWYTEVNLTPLVDPKKVNLVPVPGEKVCAELVWELLDAARDLSAFEAIKESFRNMLEPSQSFYEHYTVTR